MSLNQSEARTLAGELDTTSSLFGAAADLLRDLASDLAAALEENETLQRENSDLEEQLYELENPA